MRLFGFRSFDFSPTPTFGISRFTYSAPRDDISLPLMAAFDEGLSTQAIRDRIRETKPLVVRVPCPPRLGRLPLWAGWASGLPG
jgi:hypothetical protein